MNNNNQNNNNQNNDKSILNMIMPNDPNNNNLSAVNNDSMLINNTSKNIPVDVESEIPLHLRWNNINTEAPPPPVNGGLFSGEQEVGPHASIPVVPTATYMISKNLLSANPPPGATEQYVGTNRSTNNYVPMPGVYWYNDTHPINKGPYSMKVVEKKKN